VLIDQDAFDETNPPPSPRDWDESVFRFCTFDSLELEGLSFAGIMQSCTFTSCQFYWGLFNCALLAEVRFVDCSFPSTSFRTVKLVDCTFERCRFELDNLGGDCTISDCLIASTTFDRCHWIAKPSRGKRDITNTRWLGCTQAACTGFDRMF
jgi:hypothetical protein